MDKNLTIVVHFSLELTQPAYGKSANIILTMRRFYASCRVCVTHDRCRSVRSFVIGSTVEWEKTYDFTQSLVGFGGMTGMVGIVGSVQDATGKQAGEGDPPLWQLTFAE